jgi:hypothetical protein
VDRLSEMTDWKTLIDQAMQMESADILGAHKVYGQAVHAALINIQALLSDLEAAVMMETLYGAMVAYSQQVMLRMQAEDSEIGGTDHAFRTGHAYGVSCVLNHIIDKLSDTKQQTALGALDDFSDKVHDEVLIQAKAAGLMIELLDAKGEVLLD